MKLTIQEVEHVAKLARLDLTPEEKKKFQKQLSSILDYVGELGKVDTEGIEPTSQVTGLKDILRLDKVVASEGEVKGMILGNVPSREGGHLKVRGVFEEE
jgi:aspartyl-tRNA(Asn)/glutamyl-tRNA(Gln) amidotransferase subunit C